MTWHTPLSDLDYGTEEANAVRDVLDSKWLTMDGVTERFEQAFAKYLEVGHAIAVSNATVALHLANLSLEIGAGDEVIVPSLTFVATANAVKYTGAVPIFADITSEQDLGISPEAIRMAITRRSRAIAVMHYGGYPCDMPAILELAQEHGLAVIEDAAHAPGAELNGRKAGTWGDLGCFSFFSNKNLVTGEGGMVVTNHDDLAERVRLLRSHGMTSMTWDRHKGHAQSYDVIALGYNYRIDEIRSALGLVQMGKLEANNERRRRITEYYRREMAELEHISLPYSDHIGISAAHIFPILLDVTIDRARFRRAMHTRGIQTSIHYPPVHRFTYYRQSGNLPQLPVTDDVAAHEVTLPLYPSISKEQVEMVIDTVQNALKIASI